MDKWAVAMAILFGLGLAGLCIIVGIVVDDLLKDGVLA